MGCKYFPVLDFLVLSIQHITDLTTKHYVAAANARPPRNAREEDF